LNSASNPNRLSAWLISSTVIIESPFLSNISKIRRSRSELRLRLRSRNDRDGDVLINSCCPITLEQVLVYRDEWKGGRKWVLYCFVELIDRFLYIAKKVEKSISK
jgi:hypothetical protein